MPVDIQLDYDRGVPIYRQITDAVLGALASGRLAQDEQLPTIHDLAGRIGVNPNTVARSYRDLERSGHIVATRGRGTFPAPEQPQQTSDPKTLERIYTRAVSEAAQHSISPTELVTYFHKALHGGKKNR